MASYPTYNARFYDGPAIGHLNGYVPQGIAHWKPKDALVLSYYDDRNAGSPALLSIRNRLGQKNEQKWVRIVGGHAGVLRSAPGTCGWPARTSRRSRTSTATP